MANLMPQPEIARAWSEYRARIILVASGLMLFAAIVFILALLPSEIVITNASASLSNDQASSTAEEQFISDKAEIGKINATAHELASVLVSTSSAPEETIVALVGQRPSGVHIDQINYTTGPKGIALLSGTAATGDEVSTYRQALAKNPLFKSVSVPVSSLIGQNESFTITITGSL